MNVIVEDPIPSVTGLDPLFGVHFLARPVAANGKGVSPWALLAGFGAIALFRRRRGCYYPFERFHGGASGKEL